MEILLWPGAFMQPVNGLMPTEMATRARLRVVVSFIGGWNVLEVYS